jgi:GT2 family glycosyltransferase
LIRKGDKILFCPEAVVWHPARDRWSDFVRWQFKRGMSAYIFSTRVDRQGDFVSLRLWSTINIIKTWSKHWLFPLIMILLVASAGIQAAGFFWKRCRLRNRKMDSQDASFRA